MLLKVSLAILVILVAVLVFAALKPPKLIIQRSVIINASAENIFPLIDDLFQWREWNEQEKADPKIVRKYSGPSSGKDAVYEWDSLGSSGKGRLIIAESLPPKRVVVIADLVKPLTTHNVNEFVLEPSGSSTRVVWNWEATNIYILKLLSVFRNPDPMIGSHFEESLANLKVLAEQK
jgi:hypothetical protein